MTQSTDHDHDHSDEPIHQLVAAHVANAKLPSIPTRGAGIVAYNSAVVEIEVGFREPRADEVQVKVVSTGLGLWDTQEMQGMVELPLPKAIGWQSAGLIEKVGEDVDTVAVGDAVLTYVPMGGTLAERITVPVALVTPAPASVPLADAAALLIGAATAYQALVDVAGLKAGQTVLITAASGGTGAFAVELAKHLGAHVIGTASPRNHDFLRELGIDEVYDYNADAVAAIAEQHPDGVDLLLDNVSPDNFSAYAGLVRQGGTALGTHEPQPAAPDGVHGELVASWERPASFASVVKLVDDGVLHLRIRSRFKLDEAEQALEELREKRGGGAVVVEL